MGVDKKNIRSVLHREPSPSVEAYLQESGRAGRDGERSHAVVLLSREDIRHAERIEDGAERERYRQFIGALEDRRRCRRESLLELLDAEVESCFGCDVCARSTRSRADGEERLLRFFHRHPFRFSRSQASAILRAENSLPPSSGRVIKEWRAAPFSQWEEKELDEAVETLLEASLLFEPRRGPWKKSIGPKYSLVRKR